jgi:hypothetical protein
MSAAMETFENLNNEPLERVHYGNLISLNQSPPDSDALDGDVRESAAPVQ